MNITESRVRRLIRSVINETNQYEREVNNREWKEFHDTSKRQGAERGKANIKRSNRDFAANNCAETLTELFLRPAARKTIGLEETPATLQELIILAHEQKSPLSRKFLLEITSMSSYMSYLDSDVFWEAVKNGFEEKVLTGDY